MERESRRGKNTCCSSKVWMKEECEWDWFGEGEETVVMRGRERERERKEQKENGMLKGTERGKFIFCFKEAENEKGADAPVEGERKSKTFAPAGNRTRGERMGTVHFTIKPLARED